MAFTLYIWAHEERNSLFKHWHVAHCVGSLALVHRVHWALQDWWLGHACWILTVEFTYICESMKKGIACWHVAHCVGSVALVHWVHSALQAWWWPWVELLLFFVCECGCNKNATPKHGEFLLLWGLVIMFACWDNATCMPIKLYAYVWPLAISSEIHVWPLAIWASNPDLDWVLSQSRSILTLSPFIKIIIAMTSDNVCEVRSCCHKVLGATDVHLQGGLPVATERCRIIQLHACHISLSKCLACCWELV